MTSYAIVISAATKSIRRIIADDHGNISQGVAPNAVISVVVTGPNTVSYHPIHTGEQIIIATPNSAIHADGPNDWANHVQSQTGIVPPTSIAALIDNTNTVTQMIWADAALDAAPVGFTMVNAYSPAVCIGCTYSSSSGLFTAPGYTIPAGAPGGPATVPPTVIPKP